MGRSKRGAGSTAKVPLSMKLPGGGRLSPSKSQTGSSSSLLSVSWTFLDNTHRLAGKGWIGHSKWEEFLPLCRGGGPPAEEPSEEQLHSPAERSQLQETEPAVYAMDVLSLA